MAPDIKSAQSKWAELNSNMLHHIYMKLYDIVDFIHFRAVCRGWRASAPLSEHPPQFPLLLEGDPLLSSEFNLYSLHTGMTHSIQLPQVQNKMFFGQSQGRLVTFGTGDDSLPAIINPFTRAELPLPFGYCNYFSPIYIGTTNPIQNPDDVVIHVHCPGKEHCLGVWDKRANCWGLRNFVTTSARVCHNRKLFVIHYRITLAIDLTTGGVLLKIKLPSDVSDFYCLVEAAGALLGIVEHHLYADGVPLEKCWFEVYRLEEDEHPPRWAKLSNIGDQMVFLNSNSGFCVSGNDFDGIRGNCIYFTRWNGKDGLNSRTLIGRYELGEERSKVVGHPRDSGGTWIVPNVY